MPSPWVVREERAARFREASRPLAESLGQLDGVRIEGDSWFITSKTDTTEDEHRCDLLAGNYYCTCQGFLAHKRCKHIDRRQRMEDSFHSTEVAVVDRSMSPALARQNPAALAVRLQDMKENRRLTRNFFADVMEEGVDFGVIPGTDKPTLYKPGAEGLCELYGYAPTIKSLQETKDMESGFLRVVVTMALVQRGTGEVVAEGIGECNTREARYFYRWMPEWEIKKFPELEAVKATFKKEQRKWKDKKTGQDKSAVFYRTENDDLFTLWNTVTKMAKKRAHIDATLSATRSSGIFSQGQAALEDWIEGEFEEKPDSPAEPAPAMAGEEQQARIKKLWDPRGANAPIIRERYPRAFPQPGTGGVNSPKLLSAADADDVIALLEKPEVPAGVSGGPAVGTTGTTQPSDTPPAQQPCVEHDAYYPDGTDVQHCKRCGRALEGPDAVQPSMLSG